MRQPFNALLACGLMLAATSAPAATVEVRVSNVAAKGKVNVAVCDRERFLKQCLYSASAPAQPGETMVSLKDIPPGTWAVLAYQDANDNGQLDRNFIGVPSENYGFSRNASGRFGPPGFEDAAIEVRDGVTVTTVKLH
jgi:uncharacterized protein (DUF2141 family)